LAQSLISQGSLLNDTKAFERAKELLNRENIFQTAESKGHATFLLAEASQTFAEKKTSTNNSHNRKIEILPIMQRDSTYKAIMI
jgi:hypothetical protein